MKRLILNFYQLSFLEFVNVFKAILAIHPIFNLIEYKEVIITNSLVVTVMCRNADLNLVLSCSND